MSKKIEEVKKMEDGRMSIRFEGESKFYPVNDKTITEYIFYILTRNSKEVFQNINSACK